MLQHTDIEYNTLTPVQNDFFFIENHEIFPSILLFVALILFSIIIFFFRRKTFNALKAMGNSSGMNILLRDGPFLNETIALFMFLLYACSCSLFYYEFLNYKNITVLGLSGNSLFACVALVVILLPFLKLIICIYLAAIMKIKRSMHQMLVISTLFNFSAGVILIPILFVVMYSGFKFFFNIGLCIILINYTLCFFRILIVGFSDKKLSNIYFIIYLCTLKILPVASIAIFAARGY
ncbi:MAG: DUF4271 domain-containing protein [Bacteroidales bacterium]|nr:DUF4271 domain-containing protein [Bacteroidales bacterium]